MASTNRFDWLGFVISGVACGSLIFGLDMVGRTDVAPAASLPLILVALALGWFAIWHFRRSPHPLIDLSSLKTPTFSITIMGASLFRIAIGATPFLMPLMFQVGFGMSPVKSGLLLLAVFAGNFLMKPATTPILRWFGFRNVLLVNGVVCAVSLAACCFIRADSPEWAISALLFVGGLARSMQFTCLNAVGFADIPPERMSSASTLSSTVQQLTFAVGVAFGAISLRMSAFVRHAPTGNPSPIDFRVAFALLGVLVLASLVDTYLFVPKDAGEEVSGRRAKANPA